MSSSIDSRLYGAVLASLIALVLYNRERSDTVIPRPPGPTPLPLIGNVLSINAGEPWRTYTKWRDIYGDIVYTRLLNKEIIVLNSEEAAVNLLERRSQIYSDRMSLSTADIFGLGFATTLLPYGHEWRRHRRLFHQYFRADVSRVYHPMQLQAAHGLLKELLDSPQHLNAHVDQFSAAIIMSVMYDYSPKPRDDPIVTTVQKGLDIALRMATPETTTLLDAFPFIYYFPWTSFRHDGALARKYLGDMVEIPYQQVKQSLGTGVTKTSLVGDALQKYEASGELAEFEMAIKNASATGFGAGVTTTSGALLVFILSMMHSPEVQLRAQSEIDLLVGKNRLPTFDDRPSLPYVDAILRETLRWHPVTPLGVPHSTTSSDVYEGFYIPKGAIVVPNVWAMTHDENKYPNASQFKPERFLNAKGELNDDTVTLGYGFGRRICPGRHLADASLWAAMVSILATFSILRPTDDLENEFEPEVKWKTGLTSDPYPFQCRILPGSPGLKPEQLANLIASTM
ncbi:cytochrome P450 [Hygrophoropsis aurantiaca]|uniref:Cytochrome P450 n=1 Tax=Hygrophoropsis aurantiaca TaxID=72124 RepID=A0ACB7ZW38_9AGAM|nr:cytochrome P450 [Hygrophoropsis aurantiaca]